MANYRVTAPMVTVRTDNDRIVYLYFGDVVPAGASKDSIAHLRSLGFVSGEDAPVATVLPVVVVDAPDPVVGGDVEKPAGNATLEEWAAYARSQGATDGDLAGKSRNEVRDLYK